jgi:hypothetical protein
MLTLERRKPRNRAPLLTDLGGESKRKEPQGVHAYITITKRKASNLPQENCQEKALENTEKEKRERENQALRNHAESFIHTMKVHTRSSLPPNHPSLSQDFT